MTHEQLVKSIRREIINNNQSDYEINVGSIIDILEYLEDNQNFIYKHIQKTAENTEGLQKITFVFNEKFKKFLIQKEEVEKTTGEKDAKNATLHFLVVFTAEEFEKINGTKRQFYEETRKLEDS